MTAWLQQLDPHVPNHCAAGLSCTQGLAPGFTCEARGGGQAAKPAHGGVLPGAKLRRERAAGHDGG